MDNKNEKKNVLIIGGSKGIGLGVARTFAENSWHVTVASRNIKNLNKAKIKIKEINTEILDIDVYKDVYTFFENLKFEKLNALVVSAGSISRKKLSETDIDDFEKIVRTNFISAFVLLKEASKVMRPGGSVIYISSQMARGVHIGASPSYASSKAGLESLMRHFAYEFADQEIRFNCIAPGSIDTDLPRSMEAEARQKIQASIPMKRLGNTSEVGDAALFLAGENSTYITGSVLYVAGGSYMN